MKEIPCDFDEEEVKRVMAHPKIPRDVVFCGRIPSLFSDHKWVYIFRTPDDTAQHLRTFHMIEKNRLTGEMGYHAHPWIHGTVKRLWL